MNKDLISVIIPTYNDGEYLTDTIQSALSQTYDNIEVLIADDGSTDNTAELVGAIADRRVRYFKLPHANANVARNHGIKNAKGKYVAFLDADDLWAPNHLEVCLRTISEKKCDGVYSGMKWEQNEGTYKICTCAGPTAGESFFNYVLRTGCGSQTDGLVMTTESALNVLWDESLLRHQDYDFAVRYAKKYNFQTTGTHTFYYMRRPKKSRHIDLRSCITVIERNRQDIEPDVFRKYLTGMMRFAKSIKAAPDIIAWYENELATLDSSCTSFCTENETKDELTCIIPFCNEGEEIERTVASIRRTTTSISILLINDAATDGYDYERVAKKYGCSYHLNNENCGVAMSRDIGVTLCTTPYFVLLDGHMRFYEEGWETRLLEVLKTHEGNLITSQTVAFHKEANGAYDAKESLTECPQKYNSHGAYIIMDEPGLEFTAKWAKKELRVKSEELRVAATDAPPLLTLNSSLLTPVPCVLGAVYATSKAHWQRIGGLWGLKGYGSDEQLMSIKTWLSGGGCLLMKNWGVGHLYRKKHPYPVNNANTTYNQMLLIELFAPEQDKQRYYDNLSGRNFNVYQKALLIFDDMRQQIELHRQYLEKSIFKHDLNWFFTNINNKVK